jgi:glycosyltransferase involved in cell wall biosynthesis
MKMVFLVIDYPPLSGGLSAYIKGIVDLTEKIGYQTVVITVELNPSMIIEGKRDTNIIQLPVLWWFKDSPIINPYSLYNTLSKIKPDIVHVVYPFPIGLDIACLYAFHKKKKLYCTYVDDVIMHFPYSLIVKLYENTSWKICKKIIRSIGVLSIKYAASSIGLRDWKKSLTEINPPVFNTKFEFVIERKQKAKERLNINLQCKIVLFVGSLRKRTTYKRLDLLLKAWSVYLKQNQTLKAILMIIGDGELRDYYEKMASTLGLIGRNTVFKGFVSKDELIEYYLAGDILVLPSEDNNEAFGIVIAEAMLYGDGIICSDIPGIRGVIDKSDKREVSIIAPGNWEPIVKALDEWMIRDIQEYAILNHSYIKCYFSNDLIKKNLTKMYADNIY